MFFLSPKISQIQPAIVITKNHNATFKAIINIDTNDIILDQVYALRIINSYNNAVIEDIYNGSVNEKGELIFNLIFTQEENISLKLNNYYKLQIAYKTGEEIGPYSNIGIAKCIEIPNLVLNVNTSTYDVNLIINNSNNERIKWAEFVYSIGGKTVHISNKQVFDNSTNILTYKMPCTFYLHEEKSKLKLSVKVNYITYSNYKGHEEIKNLSIPFLSFSSADTHDYEKSEETGLIKVKNDCKLVYKKKEEFIIKEVLMDVSMTEGVSVPITMDTKVTVWDKLGDNGIDNDKNIYAYELNSYLLQKNDRLFLLAERVDFEDSFLFDKNNNYILKFNPKVSSFKEVRQEQKVETIGSQYPFVYRNEIIRYKEFQIGGLISRLSELINKSDLYRERTNSEQTGIYQNNFNTNLTGANIAAERAYKLDMLAWLNNGKPKVFKSPTEGNFIIRLMNVSLTPEDKLGRMLHSFTATAVEIAEYNIENLKKYNLL